MIESKTRDTIHACHIATDTDAMDFPEIVGRLISAGVESYAVDFRRRSKTYYLPDGDSLVLESPAHDGFVAARFDAGAIEAAVREAQAKLPGYSYAGFCGKVMAAGCAGYIVSFPGRRAVYLGRTAETHVEHFPPAP
ncbi:DUF1398 domain-containing protein [Ensifer soli]|uniref:DUF1398 domain-containing protein n=1 Tax=Ciceribacter sp. sgz301302 TaxID=3342379 RepID=UPI0035BB3B03